MDFAQFDKRPVIAAIAGPNGAGKTTFYYSHLQSVGLLFINVDVLAHELDLEPYPAARVADALRHGLLKRRESFGFETVFSDLLGDRLAFLKQAVESGYTVISCYIGVAGPNVCEQRVAMRVSQGGHDVPTDKLQSRFPRTVANLRAAIRELPHVLVFDNDDLAAPFRQVAVFDQGRLLTPSDRAPAWLKTLLP